MPTCCKLLSISLWWCALKNSLDLILSDQTNYLRLEIPKLIYGARRALHNKVRSDTFVKHNKSDTHYRYALHVRA